jgi:hypothetical protein
MNSIRSDLATRFRTRVGPGVFDISGSQLHTPEDRKVFRQRIGWATKKVEDGQGSNREGQGKNPGHQLQRADLEVHVTIARAQPSGTAEEVCVEEDVDAFDVEVHQETVKFTVAARLVTGTSVEIWDFHSQHNTP